ncbi:hypothetical protein Pmani_013343 [Petrolisthes manimaculis]|uniref:Uncharacterized protein n=1 Tax=Petrolisthes manimaculis TaxID=1843537 RepID=A0AAE1UC87_9EUCA|nr:hypothetical protein Pmani_013343 [Petrolisthes manimaculis]
MIYVLRGVVDYHCQRATCRIQSYQAVARKSLLKIFTSLRCTEEKRRWRQDAEQAPPILQTHTGYIINEEYTKLELGEMVLQHDSGIEDENRILVFAYAQGLRDLVRYKS